MEKDQVLSHIEARQALAKSRVRVWVTYSAMLYVFGGGLLLMIIVLIADMTESSKLNVENMKDIFMTVLPIATGVITYWFADRTASKRQAEDTRANRAGTHGE